MRTNGTYGTVRGVRHGIAAIATMTRTTCGGLLAAAVLFVSASALDAQQCATITLVRHAETNDEDRSRPLSPAGEERAQILAWVTAEMQVDRIFTTDLLRTRGTAQPTADARGIELEVYDPRDLGGFAEMLLGLGENVLVSGHSNTTPALAEALGGEPGEPIAEATEHDRLYLLTVCDGTTVSSLFVRYGPPG